MVPDLDSKNAEGLFDKLADRVGLASGKDEIIRSVLLEHHPHPLDVVTSYSEIKWDPRVYCGCGLTMSPITPGVEVTEVETLLLAEGDICRSPGNLTSDEGPSSPRALVVKQDAVTGIHAVCLPVVDGDPESVELGNTVGGTGVERGSFRLGSLNNLSI